MPKLNLDFSNVEPPKPFTEEDHVFLIEEADIKENKKKDGHNLVLKLRAMGGENDGKTLTQYLSLHENSLWVVKLFLEALTGEEVTEIDIETEALAGQTFVGTIRNSEDNGRTYSNIVAYASAA